jgi:hypothetical protein
MTIYTCGLLIRILRYGFTPLFVPGSGRRRDGDQGRRVDVCLSVCRVISAAPMGLFRNGSNRHACYSLAELVVATVLGLSCTRRKRRRKIQPMA